MDSAVNGGCFYTAMIDLATPVGPFDTKAEAIAAAQEAR